MFSLRSDLKAMQLAALRLPACRLIIIDPISAYLDGTNSHNNAEVRVNLAPMAEIAAAVGAAFVCVSQFEQRHGIKLAMYRTTGSLAFVAAARAAFCRHADKDNPRKRRLILPMKNNLAPEATGGVAYAVFAPHGVPMIAWEPEPVTITADEALAPERREGDASERDRHEREEALRWLREFLSSGPRGAKETQDEARAAGISLATLRRAKDELPIETYKEGFGLTGCWAWRLKVPTSSAVFALSEHLNEDPHGMGVPAKALSEQERQGPSEHLSPREEFDV